VEQLGLSSGPIAVTFARAVARGAARCKQGHHAAAMGTPLPRTFEGASCGAPGWANFLLTGRRMLPYRPRRRRIPCAIRHFSFTASAVGQGRPSPPHRES
jgi:hypothetical protein